jgi:hypothetical protein
MYKQEVNHYFPMPELEYPLTKDEFLQSVSPRAYRTVILYLVGRVGDHLLANVVAGKPVLSVRLISSPAKERGSLEFRVIGARTPTTHRMHEDFGCYDQRWFKFGAQIEAAEVAAAARKLAPLPGRQPSPPPPSRTRTAGSWYSSSTPVVVDSYPPIKTTGYMSPLIVEPAPLTPLELAPKKSVLELHEEFERISRQLKEAEMAAERTRLAAAVSKKRLGGEIVTPPAKVPRTEKESK